MNRVESFSSLSISWSKINELRWFFSSWTHFGYWSFEYLIINRSIIFHDIQSKVILFSIDKKRNDFVLDNSLKHSNYLNQMKGTLIDWRERKWSSLCSLSIRKSVRRISKPIFYWIGSCFLRLIIKMMEEKRIEFYSVKEIDSQTNRLKKSAVSNKWNQLKFFYENDRFLDQIIFVRFNWKIFFEETKSTIVLFIAFSFFLIQ